jgi:hypothetical protein
MNPAVIEFMMNQPYEKRLVMLAVRDIIFKINPDVIEKLSYGIPFYHLKGLFCYLNPTKNGLDLCFMDGVFIDDPYSVLTRGKRKRVKSFLVDWENPDPDDLTHLYLQIARKYRLNEK